MNIIFEFLNFLFDIERIAPFLEASSAYKFPSNFLPFMPIKIEFSFIFFEFIDAKFIGVFFFK